MGSWDSELKVGPECTLIPRLKLIPCENKCLGLKIETR